ncbi:shikimate dehydrogenase, partial [Klebsiella pneumoniae]
MVSGTTQVVAVIGHPIAQVKSPDNFNRYFAEQHMDSIMIPVDIVPDAVAAYLNALRGWQNMTGVLLGMMVGRFIGPLLGKRAEILGGIVLIGIGSEIL